jgi:hypothetical protein
MDTNAILFAIALGVLLVGVRSFGFWLQRLLLTRLQKHLQEKGFQKLGGSYASRRSCFPFSPISTRRRMASERPGRSACLAAQACRDDRHRRHGRRDESAPHRPICKFRLYV